MTNLLSPDADRDPNRANVAALVATEPADPNLAHQIDPEQRSAGWFEPRASDEPVAIGERTGWYRAVPGSGHRVAFLHFDHHDLTVTILAMQVSQGRHDRLRRTPPTRTRRSLAIRGATRVRVPLSVELARGG